MSLAFIQGNRAELFGWNFTMEPMAADQATGSENHTRLFIFLMEKALIGALISLWTLAAWVILEGVRSLIF